MSLFSILFRELGLYPKRMYINRGNHEAKDMNRTYGFEGEAKHKHGEQTYKVFIPLIKSSIAYIHLGRTALRPCIHST
jgi:hypothetical protein